MIIDRQAFDGVTVLDFTQGVAGPHSTMLLALNGADVIKIEPPEGDWGRGLGELFGDHCAHSVAFNRGKRSIALDLKAPAGMEVVKRIAAKADVVVESFRPGVMNRLGRGYEAMKAVNPKVIYCSVSGFGQTGPFGKRPTVDSLIQAFTGMMVMNRTADGTPHRQGMIAVDVMTGLYTFIALSTALTRMFRFGTGSYIDSSLMKAAASFQTAKMMEHVVSKGAPPPLYVPGGMFRTADGYISIGAMRPRHFQALFEVVGHPDFPKDPRFATHISRLRNAAAINKILNEEFPKRTSAEWLKALHAVEVYAERVNNYDDYLGHEHVEATGAIDWVEHPGVGRIPVTNLAGFTPARDEPRFQRAPHLGEDGEAILHDMGYAAAEIARLFEQRAVRRPAPAAQAAE
jgi:crotonobetainyl-CoA:carnitine CoA-transferase CaiB-like acyl-CoA transferase